MIMRDIAGKLVFRVCDQVQHKSGCTTTEDGFGFRKLRNCTIYIAKIKALISCAADLQPSFRICKKQIFSFHGSFIFSTVEGESISEQLIQDMEYMYLLNCSLEFDVPKP